MAGTPDVPRCIAAGIALILLAALIIPVNAAGMAPQRTIAPAQPQPGGIANITITLPSGYFGGIIETLPEGFTFEGTSHPQDGVTQSGRMVIFAVTGEDSVSYAIRAPASGCGVIAGKWEDLGTGVKGEIPVEIITVAGSDSSHCSTVPHTPGFSWLVALAAVGLACCIILREVRS